MRTIERLLAVTLASTLSVGGLGLPRAWAAPPVASDQARITEAEQLYKQGKTKYETADYEQALALWKEAYAMLPDNESAQAIRHALVYNISEAQIKAYEVNRNVTHLRKAKMLLEDYLASHRQLYGDDPSAAKERTEARERLVQVEKMIGEAEARGEQGTPIAEGGGTSAPATTTPPATPPLVDQPPPKQLSPEEQAKRDRIKLLKEDPIARSRYSSATGLVVGGAVMAGAGAFLGLIGLFVWSAAQTTCAPDPLDPASEPDPDCTRQANIIALALGVPGLGLMGGGAAMIGIGAKRRSDLKNPQKPIPGVGPAAAPAPAPAAFVSPWFSREGGGAALTVRF